MVVIVVGIINVDIVSIFARFVASPWRMIFFFFYFVSSAISRDSGLDEDRSIPRDAVTRNAMEFSLKIGVTVSV